MNELEDLRKKIDVIDQVLVFAFDERMELVKKVAELKGSTHKQVKDNKREKAILAKVLDRCTMTEYVPRLYKTIFTLSREYQNNILGEMKENENNSSN